MNASKDEEHVLRRVMIIVLLPLTIFIWMAGWTLYWIGDQSTVSTVPKRKTVTALGKDDFEESNARKVCQPQILK